MPRITEEHREARRQQILDAARACVLEHGLEAVSMEMIIARSGLSTGAVYRYFKGKDELIAASVAGATAEIGADLSPILEGGQPASPAQLMENLLSAVTAYSHRGVGAAAGIDRMPVAVHGWSYALTEPKVRATVRAGLHAFRAACVPIIERWQADGTISPGVEPAAVAQLIVSIWLGFMAQRSLADAQVTAHAEALAALTCSHRQLQPYQTRNPVPRTRSSARRRSESSADAASGGRVL
jgi:AcrR family transcriptional regulator